MLSAVETQPRKGIAPGTPGLIPSMGLSTTIKFNVCCHCSTDNKKTELNCENTIQAIKGIGQ